MDGAPCTNITLRLAEPPLSLLHTWAAPKVESAFQQASKQGGEKRAWAFSSLLSCARVR